MILNRASWAVLALSAASIPALAQSASERPAASAGAAERPHPKLRPAAPLMLAGKWTPKDPRTISFERLPRIPSEHVIVSDVRTPGNDPAKVNKTSGGVNQHNYLIHHNGQFWIMWSDGPGVEDRVGQRVRFAVSADGMKWSRPEFLTPPPPGSGPETEHYGKRTRLGYRWIARGFWLRGNEILALASLDEAAEFFGPSLALRAFRWQAERGQWRDCGVIQNDAINNFPPELLPDGHWMMSRRRHDYKKSGVDFLIGGRAAIDRWQSIPVLGTNEELAAEEPLWWTLPDQSLLALFRDNRRSGFLYRSFSTDMGRHWSRPVRTNFPDATSKMHGLRLRCGKYVLVSNANPARRDPLTIAVSNDGMVFTQLGYLVGGRHVDYPHAFEHGDSLFVAFSGGKQTVEVLRLNTAELLSTLAAAQP